MPIARKGKFETTFRVLGMPEKLTNKTTFSQFKRTIENLF